MADARRRHDWGIASSLMATIAEIHRDRKKRGRPYKAAEFNPLITSVARPLPTTVSQLATALGRSFTSQSESQG